jgi:hypothetical protein
MRGIQNAQQGVIVMVSDMDKVQVYGIYLHNLANAKIHIPMSAIHSTSSMADTTTITPYKLIIINSELLTVEKRFNFNVKIYNNPVSNNRLANILWTVKSKNNPQHLSI